MAWFVKELLRVKLWIDSFVSKSLRKGVLQQIYDESQSRHALTCLRWGNSWVKNLFTPFVITSCHVGKHVENDSDYDYNAKHKMIDLGLIIFDVNCNKMSVV